MPCGTPETEGATHRIGVDIARTAPATACAECGQCEGARPQQLKVIEELAKAARLLES